jgi:hypothetical protein
MPTVKCDEIDCENFKSGFCGAENYGEEMIFNER